MSAQDLWNTLDQMTSLHRALGAELTRCRSIASNLNLPSDEKPPVRCPACPIRYPSARRVAEHLENVHHWKPEEAATWEETNR